MRWMVLATVLLAACPKGGKAPAPPPDRLELDVLGPMWPTLCVSTIPEAGRPPKDDRAPLQSALDKLALNKANEATAALATALPSPAITSVRATAELLQGNTATALARYDELVAAWPNDACLLRGAALARHLGRSPDALPLALASLAANPDDPQTHLLVAILHLLVPDEAAAKAQLLAATQAFPNDQQLHAAYGVILLETGQAAEAVPVLTRATELGAELGDAAETAAFKAGLVGPYLQALARKGEPVPGAEALLASSDPEATWRAHLGLGAGDPTVHIDTTAGRLSCVLHPTRAPLTVSVFVGLGTGKLAWTDPRTNQPSEAPLYPGTVLHRVIPGFMAQGGDPLGTGTGGPGFRFRDEVRESDAFDRPGLLAMANAGPGTNGSQFFITEVATPWLSGKHTIFGTCTEETVAKVKEIATLPRGASDRPETPITITAFTLAPAAP